MISKRQLPELRAFGRAESGLPIRTAPELATLVVPNGNGVRPVHRWFKYKEAFSADLLKHILNRIASRSSLLPGPIRLLDPFCGVGTTLLSAQLLSGPRQLEAIGIECNPFSAFVARTKLLWPLVDPTRLQGLAAETLSHSSVAGVRLPALSSIRTGRCITRHASRQILAMRSRIETLLPSVERDVLLLGLAACVEPASRIRRDGRALRIVDKPRSSVRRLLANHWEVMAEDVNNLQNGRAEAGLDRASCLAEVRCGDGRRLATAGIADESVDLIVTSPPYPNNIDYNEVYKLELWFLGFASSQASFLRLRRKTFRSHPTCAGIEEEADYESVFAPVIDTGPLRDLLGLLAKRVRAVDEISSRGRRKVLFGYLYDLWVTLRSHCRALKTGGRAVYVVGNSLHGGPSSRPYLIPTDLILCCLARVVGLEVEELVIARPLSRRLSGNHFLRDSLVILRKA